MNLVGGEVGGRVWQPKLHKRNPGDLSCAKESPRLAGCVCVPWAMPPPHREKHTVNRVWEACSP